MNDDTTNHYQVVRDHHFYTHDQSAANGRFLARQLELAGVNPKTAGAHPGVSRKGNTVTVTARKLVMDVMVNAHEHYSVHGYNERADTCFGKIYLGLDAGAEYDRQASKVNAAIGAVTAEQTFDLVLPATRQALAQSKGAVGDALGIVLTEACHLLFDIPDGKHIVPGGVRLDVSGPARCPGDYNFPSALIFYPDPPGVMSGIGMGHGQGIRTGADALAAEWRAAGKKPSGLLSRAVFDTFPDDDDLAVRTLLGVMMGMIPTTLINMGNCLKTWSSNDHAGFKQLGMALAQHGGNACYDRAAAVLMKPLTQAIQVTPEPPAVWRTAVADHDLGGMSVKAGDKIIVSILEACHQDLADDTVTLAPVFGGDRGTANHPLHACPGAAIAMGFMLAFTNGVVEPK